MIWKEISIGEIGQVITGNTPPRKNPEFYGNAYKFIKPTDMDIGNRYTPVTEDFYSEIAYEKYIKSLIPPLSTCVVTIGSIGQKMTLTDSYSFINQAVNAVIPNTEKFDQIFIFYALKNILHKVKSADTGASSGRENVSKSNFMSLKLDVPTNIETQKKIGSVLSSFDDLIENNIKRIKLLEETAQNIYKEWFVNFRFPNYEHSEFDAESGLPVGWRNEKVTNYFEFVKGIEVGSANYESVSNSETLPFLRVGDISKRDGGIYVKKSLVKDKIVEKNDILISFDGSIGSVGYGLEGSYSSGLRKIMSKNEIFGKGFLYCLVKSDNIQNTINAHAKGTTILHAGTSIIHLEFPLATANVILSFNQITNPIFEQMVSLNHQNQKLKEARDIMLPRLMNRTIEV